MQWYNIILSHGGLKPPPPSLRYPCAACKPIIDVLYYIILSLHACNQSSTDTYSLYIIVIGIYEHNILIPKGTCPIIRYIMLNVALVKHNDLTAA